MSTLAGKHALVVGAAGRDNMGQGIARRFRSEGAQVSVAGRNMDELARLAAELEGYAFRCDLTAEAEIADAVEGAHGAMGELDIVVNATGWGLLKPFLATTGAELDQMTALQFRGPFQLYQATVRAMQAGGSIIQISSATATILLEDHAAYMGTKAGVDHVIRCIANEFGHRGIRANAIAPGLTETPMTAGGKAVPGVFEAFAPSYPLGRIGTVEDIAAAAVWLASDECFMTGQVLQVNGGLTLRRNPTNAEIRASVKAVVAGRS